MTYRTHASLLERIISKLGAHSFDEAACEGRPPIFEMYLGSSWQLQVSTVPALSLGIEAIELQGCSDWPQPGLEVSVGPLLLIVSRWRCWQPSCDWPIDSISGCGHQPQP